MTSQVEHLRQAFLSGKTKPISWRRNQLKALIRLLDDNTEKLCNGLWEDLHKNRVEAEMMEVAQVRNEAVLMLDRLEELTGDKKSKKGIASILNNVKVIKEAYGVVLIMSPWNYPLSLVLQPLVGAIAAGNCVMLKPSEISASTGRLIEELIPQYLDNDCYTVVVCDAKGSSDLLANNRFDMIMFTGGTNIAKIVMQAAAKHLTPVTLELGGKNPCYVDASCDLESTANCLTWGKWTNAGQICISPDFVLCAENMKAPLVSALKKCIIKYYGEDQQKSSSYGRIINERHVKRLKSLLDGVDIVYGGVVDEENRYFSPTIVTNVRRGARILEEEIFGPILPVITVKNVDEAIEFMNTGEKSLQLSIFAKNRSVIEKIINETSSGGVTVNELLMQNNEIDLPFGGVGQSGMGCVHGDYSYHCFSHERGYFESKTPEFALKNRYPPCSAKKLSMLKPLLYKRQKMFSISTEGKRIIFAALFGLLIAYFTYFSK